MSNNLSIVKEKIILICISLLVGGNSHVQTKFLEEFQLDSENSFLNCLYVMIQENFEKIK